MATSPPTRPPTSPPGPPPGPPIGYPSYWMPEPPSAFSMALRLWMRPLLLCWRYYLLAVFGYLLFRLGGWVLVTDQADLITSAADARELGRHALFEGGPTILALLFSLRAFEWIFRVLLAVSSPAMAFPRPRWADELVYVYVTIARGLEGLCPEEPRSRVARAWRWALIVAATIVVCLAIGGMLNAVFAVATIDTRYGEGPGWLLRSILYVWTITPLWTLAGVIASHWTGLSLLDELRGGCAMVKGRLERLRPEEPRSRWALTWRCALLTAAGVGASFAIGGVLDALNVRDGLYDALYLVTVTPLCVLAGVVASYWTGLSFDLLADDDEQAPAA